MNDRRRKRVVVLISGRGSNLNALLHAAIDPAYPADIAGVISNKAAAKGLESAASHNVPCVVVSEDDYETREDHDDAIDETLRSMKAEFVCLAGYMRLLSPAFVKKWQGRMINIHPALLPAFKGLNTHARALASGVRIHGCTVHFVTAGMDEGPVILQAAVPVHSKDTEETLAERVLKAEHLVYPRALAMIAQGTVRMASGQTMFTGSEEIADPQIMISPGMRDKARST